ncbi:YybH family protein [Phenylobacterium sp.]|uniref:YybH family protein n=1 Tax=Phenylobacterium sp. TaxID=1871053 RepID=UPI002ED86BE7
MKTLAAAALALSLAGPALAADLSAQAAAEALAADRAFHDRAQVVHPAQAFREFMESDGLLYGTGGDPAKGSAAIYALMGGDKPQRVKVEWVPKQAWGAASGEMAMTIGDWKRTWLDGSRVMTGNYVTVWRKTQDGWKGLIDIGEVDEAAAASTAPATPEAPPARP